MGSRRARGFRHAPGRRRRFGESLLPRFEDSLYCSDNGRWIDPDRSHELISNSLLLLQTLVSLDVRLSEAIHGNAN